jgi:hypothetical protein
MTYKGKKNSSRKYKKKGGEQENKCPSYGDIETVFNITLDELQEQKDEGSLKPEYASAVSNNIKNETKQVPVELMNATLTEKGFTDFDFNTTKPISTLNELKQKITCINIPEQKTEPTTDNKNDTFVEPEVPNKVFDKFEGTGGRNKKRTYNKKSRKYKLHKGGKKSYKNKRK